MSNFKKIVREDLEAFLKTTQSELETKKNQMYHALGILPWHDFASRDALNHEIAANIGEQRALTRVSEWVSENHPSLISQNQLKDKYDGVKE